MFRRKSIKSALPAAAVVVSAFVVMMIITWPRYYVQASLDRNVTVLYNTNECFLFIEKHYEGAAVSLVGGLWRQFRGMFANQIDASSGDLNVVHLAGKQVDVFILNKFGRGGGAFPLRGEIYFGRGTADPYSGPPVWKWSGTNFARLADPEAKKINSSFTSDRELIAREGWKEEELLFDSRNNGTRFTIGDITHSLALIEDSNTRISVRKVILDAQSLFECQLYERMRVNRETYLSYFGSKEKEK
jgi:hypothetical protein